MMRRTISTKEAQAVILTEGEGGEPIAAIVPWTIYEASTKALEVFTILLDILDETGLTAAVAEHRRSGSKAHVSDPYNELRCEEYLD